MGFGQVFLVDALDSHFPIMFLDKQKDVLGKILNQKNVETHDIKLLYLLVSSFEHNSKGAVTNQVFPVELKLPNRLHALCVYPFQAGSAGRGITDASTHTAPRKLHWTSAFPF